MNELENKIKSLEEKVLWLEKAEKKKHPLTESCCAMLLYNMGYYINFIEGSENNLKIIRQEDITLFAAVLNNNPNIML